MVVKNPQTHALVRHFNNGRIGMFQSRDVVAQYLCDNVWPIEVVDDTTLTVRLLLADRELHCTLKTPQGSFVMISRISCDIPDAKRELVLELVAREISQPCVSSPFLDHDTGEIGIKTAIPVEDGYLSLAVIDQVVGCNLKTAERWIAVLAELCESTGPVRHRLHGAKFATSSPYN